WPATSSTSCPSRRSSTRRARPCTARSRAWASRASSTSGRASGSRSRSRARPPRRGWRRSGGWPRRCCPTRSSRTTPCASGRPWH
ncbi:MAG: Phosphoribosylformylglycinamidine synthase, PurS subunit, partial [uncultured Nocardioides sp.]